MTNAQINQFTKGAKSFVLATLFKLLQRSPLGSGVVRCSAIFHPQNISLTSKSILQKHLKNLLSHFLELNILSPSECDKTLSEFNHFPDNDCKIFRSSFDAFEPQEKRLDNFFNDIQTHKYESLSYVIRLILTLCHGQASVERSFSENNTIPAQNMSARHCRPVTAGQSLCRPVTLSACHSVGQTI